MALDINRVGSLKGDGSASSGEIVADDQRLLIGK